MLFAAGASAADSANAVHPVIGAKPPKELKASDILALPELERQAWIHGAVSLTAQSWFEVNSDRALCVIDWYFGNDGDGAEVITALLSDYPDAPATSVLIAASRSACGES